MLVPKEIFGWIESCWGASGFAYEDPIWEGLSDRAFLEKVSSWCGDSRAFCVRLVGQSGAGKTSQLLPAVQAALQHNNAFFVSFAVRDFVKYHPHLEKIVQNYGESILREKTNTFALLLLTDVLLRCVFQKIPILLEVTLLAPIYEKYVHGALAESGYFCDYQCLSIPKKVSDAWIHQRFLETNRVVSLNSSSFFYDTLKPTFKTLQKVTLKNRVFIWDRVHEFPEMSYLQDPHLYDKIEAARNYSGDFLSLNAGVVAKTKFLCDFYQKKSWY